MGANVPPLWIDSFCAWIIVMPIYFLDNNFQIEYELHHNSTHVCITCIFPSDSSTTDCVAVVHQRISQLSSSGLMNIESSHKFNRSGNTAFECIPGIDMSRYQVGVVGGRFIETLPEQGTCTIYMCMCLHRCMRMKRRWKGFFSYEYVSMIKFLLAFANRFH